MVTWPLPALDVTLVTMPLPDVRLFAFTVIPVPVVVEVVMVNGPVDAAVLTTFKFGTVIVPVPKVTGRLVTVLIFKVEAEVKSNTGLVATRLVLTLFKVTAPVPVLKVLAPETEVGPLNVTVPVALPAEKLEAAPVARLVVPEAARLPLTSKVEPGVKLFPTPTRPLVASTFKAETPAALVKLNAEVELTCGVKVALGAVPLKLKVLAPAAVVAPIHWLLTSKPTVSCGWVVLSKVSGLLMVAVPLKVTGPPNTAGPVPTVKELVPVTLVGPFKFTAPLPVEKLVAPL